MQDNKTSLVFTGDAGNYFGIWIVNVFLSIITLGIYSAWAKVRRMKYFYNNTKIDGVGFDYHAKPTSILIGRLIAFAAFVAYTVLSRFSPLMGGLLLLALFVATPWIIVRSLIFNARNSSHRGLRFDFVGKTGRAALVFIAYPFLVIFTLGLAIPFVAQRSNKFVFEHHKFGMSHFQSEALVKDFYKIYLKLFGCLLAIGLTIALTGKFLFGVLAPSQISLNQPPALEERHQVVSQTAASYQPANEVDKQKMDAEQKEEIDDEGDPIKKMLGSAFVKYGALLFVFFMGAGLLYMVGILCVVAYIKSRISNLIWNNTSIEHVTFESTQRMRDLVWIYFTNALALMFSGGLATPWVHTRMARYRASHLAVIGETNWDAFVGEKKESVRALGGEMANMFDLDISFG
jgi:uncharacterized membrane protein YjgN (DUF898 family)